MRLFAGVELDRGLQAAVCRAAGEMKARIARISTGCRARWTPEENLHVTLCFLGETADDRVPAVLAALELPLAGPPFEIGIGGAGSFPPSGPPRIIWFGVRSGAGALEVLQRQVTARLQPLGFQPERRPYHGHVTIARIADAPRRDFGAIRQAVAGDPADIGTCGVGHVTLFRSRLSPKGAVYEPVLRVPLKP